MEIIYHQIIIDAAPKVVYYNLIHQEGLSKWWIADCNIKPEIGFLNTFRVEGHGNIFMEVLELDPDKKVKWLCKNVGDDWENTHITFEISLHNRFSKLDFRHTDWPVQNEFFGTCNYHWGRHLQMLKDLCETGKNQLNEDLEKNEVRKVQGN